MLKRKDIEKGEEIEKLKEKGIPEGHEGVNHAPTLETTMGL